MMYLQGAHAGLTKSYKVLYLIFCSLGLTKSYFWGISTKTSYKVLYLVLELRYVVHYFEVEITKSVTDNKSFH